MTPDLDPIDKRLLGVWEQERGKGARRITLSERDQIVRALRARYEERMNPRPLKWCPICCVNARGEHRANA